MANPQILQGTLNRLRASVVVTENPQLNVTAPFLGKEGIRLTPEGNTTVMIPTMTGTVTSPEPYQMVSVMIHLLKTQNLADLYKQRMESLATIGDVLVIPDASTLSPYPIINCAITSVAEINMSGEDAGFAVTVQGYYQINSALFDQG